MISELAEDRVVEGVFAVKTKRKLRTKGGAPFLALELVDPTGRIDARVWNDVELLDGRFGEGDAVRVLGRVERFRDRLQLDVRTLELSRGPAFAPTDEGRLLGHVHLGLRVIEERAEGLTAAQRAELLHCVAVHHDARAARTAEAAVLYHANQLDAIAATRPVEAP